MTAPFSPPYRRSWVDRLFDWVERLPGPVWLFHAAWFTSAVIAGLWFKAPNYPHIPGWMFTTISAFIFSGTHWLRSSTTRSVERVRPALELTDREVDTLSYRMTITPPRVVWVVLAIEAAYLPLYVMSDAEPFGYRHLDPAILIPGLVLWGIGETLGQLLVFMTVRRLYFISRIHRDLARVELFRQQPLHAFSSLTMRSAVTLLLLFGYIPLLSLGTEAVTDPYYLSSLVGGAVVALAVAILPLRGTHHRIAEEKRDLAMANGARIQQTLAAVRAAVDSGDTAALETKQKAMTALLSERDLIAKAPTWPWAPGTIRTLATTVLLPVVLIVAGRLADRWFG